MKNPVHTDTALITLASSKRLVETYLDNYFDKRHSSAADVDQTYARVWQSIYELFTAGGKRIRPYVTLLAYQAYAPDADLTAIVPAASAQELLHLAMLVHDDIIDRDRVRYGIANVSGQYDAHYETAISNPSERRHYADSAAILAGDLLLSDAYELLARCEIEPKLILKAQHVLNEAVFKVVGGELLDTEAAFTDRNMVRPIEIAHYKTASYSFISPLLMGATFAEASDVERSLLAELGNAVGLAYQLQDDILGMFGSSELTGKSVTGDLKEGKFTYLVQLFYELADTIMIERYEQIAGNADVTFDQAETARALLIDSGAKQALETYISDICTGARSIIGQLAVPDSHKDSLNEILDISVKRDK